MGEWWIQWGGTVFYFILWTMIIGYTAVMLILEHHFAKLRDPIHCAKHIVIGDGVTLYQGVKAYFGSETVWGAHDQNTVRIMTGLDGPRAGIVVHLRPEEVEVLRYWSGQCWEGEEGRKALIGQMVKAAWRKRALRPWP